MSTTLSTYPVPLGVLGPLYEPTPVVTNVTPRRRHLSPQQKETSSVFVHQILTLVAGVHHRYSPHIIKESRKNLLVSGTMTSSDPTTVTECEPETVVGRRHGPTPFPYSHHEVSTPLRP